MACKGCQQRREEIARIAAKVGTIVFGRKRVLAAPQPDPKPEQGKKRGKPGT